MLKIIFNDSTISYKTRKSDIKLSAQELKESYTEKHNDRVKSVAIDRLHSALSNEFGYLKWEIIYHCAAVIQKLYPEIPWDWKNQIIILKTEDAQNYAHEEYEKDYPRPNDGDPELHSWEDKYDIWQSAFIRIKTAGVAGDVRTNIINMAQNDFFPIKYFS